VERHVLRVFLLLAGFLLCCHDVYGENDIPQKVISFYQEYLSPLDTSECPSFPRCSEYAKAAIKKHGLLKGWILIVDRLFHEGSEELKVSGQIINHGKLKIYDPVENNDFWWCDER
jgi:hypothetical protein